MLKEKSIYKKVLSIAISFSMVLSIVFIQAPIKVYALGTTYYVSQSTGNDSNNGTSPTTPWKSLDKVQQCALIAGDTILLKCGDTWNESLTISNKSGTAANPIVIKSYSTGNKPKILRNMAQADYCMKFTNSAGWVIRDLEIGNAGRGIIFFYDSNTYGKEYLKIDNCYFHDIYGIALNNTIPNEPQYPYSSAIYIGGDVVDRTDITQLSNIYINNCYAYYCGSLLSYMDTITTGLTSTKLQDQWNNLYITNCKTEQAVLYGTIVTNVTGGYVDNCKFLYGGCASMDNGSTSLMLGSVKDYTLKNTEIAYQKRWGSNPDGEAVDFEHTNTNVDMQNMNIHHMSGASMMYYRTHSGVGVNDHCDVSDTRFAYDCLNPSNVTGTNIKFIASNYNQNSSFTNNYFWNLSEISFANGFDGTSTFANNTSLYPGYTLINNNDNKAVYTGNWTYDGNRINAEIFNDITYTTTNNDYVEFTFTGTGVDFISTKSREGGDIDVYIDDVFQTTISAYENKPLAMSMTPLYSKTGLINQQHKLKLVKKSGMYLIVDAFNCYNSSPPTPVTPTASSYIKTWEFDSGTDGWTAINHVSSLVQSSGCIEGIETGNDPYLISADNLNVNINEDKKIYIRMKHSGVSATHGRLFFTTTTDTSWNDAKAKDIILNSGDNDYYEYVIDMSTIPGWEGTLKQFRLDPENDYPVNGNTFSVDYIRIGRYAKEWKFNAGTEGWTAVNQITSLTQSSGCMNGTETGADPYLHSSDNLNVDITDNNKIYIKMKHSGVTSTQGRLYFITTSDSGWNDAKSKEIILNPGNKNYYDYVIDMSTVSGWTGMLKRLRLDPENDYAAGDNTFSIDYIIISK